MMPRANPLLRTAGQRASPVRRRLSRPVGFRRAIASALRPTKPKTIKQALQLQSGAEWKREIGRDLLADADAISTFDGRLALAEADSMDKAVAEFMDVGSQVTGPHSIGNGGELVVRTREAMGSVPGIIDTLRESPGMFCGLGLA
jgi:hypothetical protein